jgi:Peptidase S24-like
MSENKNEMAAPVNASMVGGERRLDDVVKIIQLLAEQGRVTLRVRGSSMLPWVKAGDVAVIRRAGIDDVRCGDVVLFQRESRLFVHRLVEKHGTLRDAQFLAKGDAHPGPDGMIGRELVLGRVVRLHRGDKRIDLDTPRQLALGLIVSQLSRKSAYWYPLARAAALFTQSVRRAFSLFRAPENAAE